MRAESALDSTASRIVSVSLDAADTDVRFVGPTDLIHLLRALQEDKCRPGTQSYEWLVQVKFRWTHMAETA